VVAAGAWLFVTAAFRGEGADDIGVVGHRGRCLLRSCICAIKTTKIEMDSRAPGARQKVPFKHPIFIVGGAPRKRGYSYTNFCGVCCCC